MDRVFVDATTYLSYYQATGKEQILDKLLGLVKNKKTELFFPEITLNEVIRKVYREKEGLLIKDIQRTENSILIQLQQDDSSKTSKKSGSDILGKIKGKLEKDRQKYLKDEINEKIKSAEQFLDKIQALKKESFSPTQTTKLINAAQRRHLLGNPPAKGGHIGDNLVWEMVLKYCTDENLYIVSDDGDWMRERITYQLNPILLHEWQQKTSVKNIFLLPTLGDFINKLDPTKPVSKEIIEKEKENAMSYTSLPTCYPGSTVTTVEPFMPASGVNVFGTVPTFTQTTTTNFETKCRECGSTLDWYGYPLLCKSCRAKQGFTW